jgi:hypothetical protein
MAELPDVQWIGTPLGPKPMSLGMLLAGLEEPITIYLTQARTYNPEYSIGIGATHGYLLRLNGARMY